MAIIIPIAYQQTTYYIIIQIVLILRQILDPDNHLLYPQPVDILYIERDYPGGNRIVGNPSWIA